MATDAPAQPQPQPDEPQPPMPGSPERSDQDKSGRWPDNEWPRITVSGASIAAKRCAVCGQWKPATPLHYYEHQHSHDGMQSMCIECCKAYRRDRWKRAMQRRVMRARKAK